MPRDNPPDAPVSGRLDAPVAAASPFHQRILAEELSLRRSGNDLARIAPTLSEAKVDLNPHQLEAAAFALEAIPNGGCVLADEVGLGKTIEAGMVIAQLVAEGKGRILVLVPAPLRAQWRDEMWEKFGLIAECLDGASAKASGKQNPFDMPVPIICSVPFASNRAHLVSRIPWDLVVIDEAHRLRNCYKPFHKTGQAVRTAFGCRPKLLLTATPLQNDLLELFGLASLLDETVLGPEDAFRAQYGPLVQPPPPPGSPNEKQILAERQEAMKDLKERLSPVVKRTLRRQVREYVRYTARRSIVEDFRPSIEEQELYDRVSEYLRREDLAAIEPMRRTLLTLVYRKILGSSSFAIAATLSRLADSLEKKIEGAEKVLVAQEQHLARVANEDDVDGLEEELRKIYEEEAEELLDDRQVGDKKKAKTLADAKAELNELREMAAMARSITSNAKGDALVRALHRSFAVAQAHGWPEKAVIFTESRRTQDYLNELLSENGYAGEISILCGDGSGPEERKALVDEFRGRTKIFLSTEAGAEGLNLQFCNLLVNYDLPWNPQRIEQRIGRCHRYGQTRDVLVINMVNRANAAEARLYDLLEQKLNLFDGVFGASDEVLGVLESGVDFERRVLEIYQGCRSEAAIDQAFQQLRGELETKITTRMQETRELLLERFDADVRSRLRIAGGAAKAAVKRQEEEAKQLALSVLGKDNVAASGDMLHVRALPQALVDAADGALEPGLYSFGDAKNAEVHGAKKLGPNSPLVKAAAKAVRSRDAGLSFLNLEGTRAPSALVPLVGKEGYWFVYKLELGNLEPEERLLHLVLVRENGVYRAVDTDTAALLAELPARETIRRPEAGGQSVTAVQDQALERFLAKVRVEFEGRRAAALDRIHEKWDRFTEESLAKGRARLAEAKEKWEAGRKAALLAAEDAERAKLRRARDLAEREYRRRLDQLRLEEQRRYADKERALTDAQRKAGAGEVRKTLVASAYWFMR